MFAGMSACVGAWTGVWILCSSCYFVRLSLWHGTDTVIVRERNAQRNRYGDRMESMNACIGEEDSQRYTPEHPS